MAVEQFTREQFEEQALPKLKVDPTKPAWKSLGLLEGEYAYLIPLPNGTAIHVRSSVNGTGRSAGSGQDSIRCWIVDMATGKPMGSKIGRWTTRLPGWGERTSKVIRELAKMAIKISICPQCHKEKLKVFIVRKKGANEGRVFLSCKANSVGCGYFEWLTEREC